MRERVSILPTSTYLSKMHDAGWTLIALEWEREVETSGAPEPEPLPTASEEIPFGLRIAGDCRHLERRGVLQTAPALDGCRPAAPPRRRMGIPQETIVPRHLELLRRPETRAVIRNASRDAPSLLSPHGNYGFPFFLAFPAPLTA